MVKERNEKLEIEKVAKNKTKKVIIIMDVIIFVIMVGISIPAKILSITAIISIIFVIAVMNLLLKVAFFSTYVSEEEHRISKEYVSKYLKLETETEVIPIKSRYYKSFVTDILPRKGRFYAIMANEEYVKIFIKFNKHNEEVYFETLHQIDFKKYYVVKEELASRVREEFNLEEGKSVEVIASPTEKDNQLAKEWLEKSENVKVRYYAQEKDSKILVEVANESGKIVSDEPVKYANYYAFYSNYEPKK